MNYSMTRPAWSGFGVETQTAQGIRVSKTFQDVQYWAFNPAIALLVAPVMRQSQILSEGPLVRDSFECPSITVSKQTGTPNAGTWIDSQVAAGNAILILASTGDDTATLAATKDIVLAGMLTNEANESGVLIEPSGGWLNSKTQVLVDGGTKALPKWVLPVAIGGGVVLLGGIAYLVTRHK